MLYRANPASGIGASAPLTLVFLVLVAPGDFSVSVGVLVGVIVAATIVGQTFGYSFATWRFHVRGLGFQGAHNISWIGELTVGWWAI